ncbi:putative glutamine amidotransferase [Clostridiales bacterium]|nr:putative glutamine amidotransferase [Clostridiales bacterium]
MKPLITISPSISTDEKELKVSRAYFEAVRNSGGMPLACDYDSLEYLLAISDGILLSGGGDIEPSLTGDTADFEHQGQISRGRDSFELALVKAAIEQHIPLLGICRGMQIIGAAMGGHIIQHMEGHMQTAPKNQPFHSIAIEKGSLLHKILGKEKTEVNSFHHQAVGSAFPGLISARAEDKTAEALEISNERFALGIQWHPELLFPSEDSRNIFEAFVRAAGRYKR